MSAVMYISASADQERVSDAGQDAGHINRRVEPGLRRGERGRRPNMQAYMGHSGRDQQRCQVEEMP